MNETLQTIKARRSVRAYMEQQVSAEDLNLILEAATYAPNGMHLETWHFTAIQNKEVLKELNDKIKGAFAKSDDCLLYTSSIISRLQRNTRSATSAYFSTPPSRSIIIMRSATSVGDSGRDVYKRQPAGISV